MLKTMLITVDNASLSFCNFICSSHSERHIRHTAGLQNYMATTFCGLFNEVFNAEERKSAKKLLILHTINSMFITGINH